MEDERIQLIKEILSYSKKSIGNTNKFAASTYHVIYYIRSPITTFVAMSADPPPHIGSGAGFRRLGLSLDTQRATMFGYAWTTAPWFATGAAATQFLRRTESVDIVEVSIRVLLLTV